MKANQYEKRYEEESIAGPGKFKIIRINPDDCPIRLDVINEYGDLEKAVFIAKNKTDADWIKRVDYNPNSSFKELDKQDIAYFQVCDDRGNIIYNGRKDYLWKKALFKK